jgi:folate-binding protein YgfZ
MVVACRVDRDVVRVAGPDATAYLHGQLSQDTEALKAGDSARSFVLQPTGKVDAWFRVTRTAADEYLLDIDGGYGEGLMGRLRRFQLRTKADIDPLDWACVVLRGPGAGDRADAAAIPAELRVPTDWPGAEGVDLLGPGVELPRDPPPGVSVADHNTYEALRISSGVPAMGAELTSKTIPGEAGAWVLDASVSFTKGCFTGQELVARIDSRGGKVPRQLVGLTIESGTVPPQGATVYVDGNEVGAVTSSAQADASQRPVALAYVRRGIEPPVGGTVAWSDGEVPVTVRTLPLGHPS